MQPYFEDQGDIGLRLLRGISMPTKTQPFTHEYWNVVREDQRGYMLTASLHWSYKVSTCCDTAGSVRNVYAIVAFSRLNDCWDRENVTRFRGSLLVERI